MKILSKLKAEVLESIENFDNNKWNNLIEHSELRSIYHKYEWLLAVEQGTELEPKHIVILKSGNPVGILPNFRTSINKTPFCRLYSSRIGSGGPVITTDEKDVLELMLKEISNICSFRDISHLILTPSLEFIRYNNFLRDRGYEPNLNNCRFIIDLRKSWENIKKDMHKDRRYDLRKGNSQSFEITEEELNEKNLKRFHKKYASVTERVKGSTFPLSLFLNLADKVKENIKLFSFSIDGETEGYHFYVLDKQRLSLFHMFSAITEDSFRYYPGELLHEHSIKWGIENGYKIYNFGGTTSCFTDGLFKYKEKFGGKAVPTISWEKGYSIFWKFFKLGRNWYLNRI